jgi:hypothetical protein
MPKFGEEKTEDPCGIENQKPEDPISRKVAENAESLF